MAQRQPQDGINKPGGGVRLALSGVEKEFGCKV